MLKKQLILTALIALPLTLYAANSTSVSGDSGNQYNPKTNPTGTYNPMYSPDENAESSTLNFNSGMFGYQGPLSIDTTYSKDYGVIVKGQFTHSLGDRQAYSLIAEGGAKQYRFNGTWGMMLSKRQELKVSLDHLAQKMDFSFASGDSRDWVSQNALGLTYQFLLHQGWLRAFNVNGFVSKANSKNLSSLDYVGSDGFTYRNDRRIAGATERSVQAGLTFLPTRWTEIDTTVNYQSVRYPMDYEASTNNSSGFGFGVSAHQIITHHLKANLSFERDQTQTSVDGGFEVLLPSPHGTSLDVKFDTQRMIGRNGGNSDTQYTAGLDFRWGVTGEPSFSLAAPAALGDLRSFVSQPAVYMDQVLAVKDERSVRLNNTPSPNVKSSASNSGNVITIPVNPKKPVSVSIAKYLPQGLAKGKQAPALSAEGLPKTLHYDAATETISGQWPTQTLKGKVLPAQDVEMSVMRPVTKPGFAGMTAHGGMASNETPVLRVRLLASSLTWLKVNPTGPRTLKISNAATFTQDFELTTTQQSGNPSALFYYQYKDTMFVEGNRLDITWPNGKPSGLNCFRQAGANYSESLRCTGTNVTPGNYTLNIAYVDAGIGLGGSVTDSGLSLQVENPDHAPIWNKTTITPQTLDRGAAVKVNGSDLNYNSYYTVPASDPMTIDATKTSQLSVKYTSLSGAVSTTTLKASNLGQDHQAGGHYLQLNGLVLKGNIPDTAPPGQYDIVALPVNNIGAADQSLKFTITVTGPPQRKPGTAPTQAPVAGGASITTVNYANYYYADTASGNLTINTSSKTYFSVVYTPPQGSAQSATTLAASNLGAGLTVSGATLSGAIPAGTPAGQYTLMALPQNTKGVASEAVTYSFQVKGAPIQNGKPSPESAGLKTGQSLPNISFASAFQYQADSGVVTLDLNNSTYSVGTGSPQPLMSGSSPFKTMLTSSAMTLSGTVPTTGMQAGQYTLNIKARNDQGTSLLGSPFVLTVGTAPQSKNKPVPPQGPLAGGEPLTSVDYGVGYYESNETSIAGNLTINASDTSQLSVVYTAPGGTPGAQTTLKASNLGQDHASGGSNYLRLNGLTLEGNIPVGAPAGQYTISARPVNNVGPADKAVTYSFQVKGAPIYKAAPTPASQNQDGGSPLTAVSFANSFALQADSGAPSLDWTNATYTVNGSSAAPVTGTPFATAFSASGMSITGTVPGSGITAGTYVFSVKAKNAEGTSVQAASFTLVVGALPSLPTYTGASLPDTQKTQTIVVGAALPNAINLASPSSTTFFSNPPNSGTRSIDGAAAATVSFVPKDPSTPAATTSLQNSNLFAASGKTLAINGMTLQGDIPDNNAIAGTYTITFKVKNNQGTSASGPQAVFTVQTKAGVPVYKGGTVSGLTPLDPGANVPSQLSFGTNTYFENPDNSGAMRMVDNDAAVVSVAYKAPGTTTSFGAPQALNVSRLYNGGSGVRVSTTTPTALTGSIPASSSAVPMGGTYRFSVHMRNNQGPSASPLTFDLEVRGVPVPNSASLPTVPSYSAGDSFTAVDFGSVYANPPDSGALGISGTDAQEMAVCYSATSPGAGASCDPSSGQSLNASALGAAGSGQTQALSLSNTSLTGTVPSNTPVGYYILSVHPHNGMSGINNGRAYTARSLVLHVANTTGVPTFLANPSPASQSVNPAQSAQIANVDFGSSAVFKNPNNSGPIVLSATQSADMSVTCTNNHGTACQGTAASALASSPLGGSGGLSIAANGGNTAQLTGNIPASAPGATYTFTVHAKNNLGSSVGAATYTINVEGKPYVYSQDPTKPPITRNGGDTLSLDYAPNYVNPPGSGNLSLSGTDPAQVQVCYQSNCTDLDNSPLGAKNHTAGNYLSVQTGTAMISGKIPGDVTPGDYTINVHANNSRGVSADAVSFVLTVGNVPGVPGYNGHSLPLAQQILDPGQAIQDVNYEPNYESGSYFSNAVNSGDLRLVNNDENVLNVAYQAPGQSSPSSPTSLAGSNLSALTLSGGTQGAGYYNMILGGTLPASVAAGTYTITARAQNDKGVASTGPSWTLFVRGKPEIKQGTAKPALPTKQIVGIGSAITSVDFSSYYNNPPQSGNPSLDADSPAQVAVAYTPNAGGKMAPLPGSLAASNLSSLQVNNGVLSGSVTHNAAIEGTYDVTTHVANSQGIATDSVPLQIVVSGPPVYQQGSVNPANQFLSPGASINSANADFASNFNNPLDGGARTLKTTSLNEMAVQYKAPGASSFGSPTTLAESGLSGGLTVSGTALSGSIPAGAPVGTYLITVHMANNFDITTPSSPTSDGPQIELVVTGAPTWNNQTPTITPIAKGSALSTVSFENNFTNPNGTADPMKLATSGAASDGVVMVQYQDPSSGAWSTASTLATALPGLTLGGGDASTTWRNMQLGGTIPTSSSVQPGQYRLIVRPANSTAAASQGPDPILTLQGVPMYNNTVLPNAHVGSSHQLAAMNLYTAFGNPNGTANKMSLAISGTGNNVLNVQHQDLFTDAWGSAQAIGSALPGLVLSGDADDHGGWSGMILSGTLDSNVEPGAYRLRARPANNTGPATSGPDPVIYVDGVPQIDASAALPTLGPIRAGDTLPNTDLHGLFGNPNGTSDPMSLATSGTGNNVLKVEYEAPSSSVWGAPTPMATLLPGLTLTGGGNDRGGWQNMILGGTLGAAQPGRYRLLINPGNQSGQQAAGPELTLSVQGAPIRTGTTVNPISQSVGGTLNLNFASTGDNPLGYYVNPVDSGTMRIDAQDAQVQQPGSSTLIQFNSDASALYNKGQGLTLNNMVLSGAIPAVTSGTYKLFFRPMNDIGKVSASDKIELDLTIDSIPKRNSEYPQNSVFYAGGAFTPETDSTALTLSKYFTPNNQLYFSPNDSSSIAVCPGTTTICLTTLSNSGLGLTYDARQDSPNIQSSELIYPKAYQSKASQQFTMTVTPRAVSQGPLGEPLHYTFTIIGRPVYNGTVLPVDQKVSGSAAISDIKLSDYFVNDDASGANPIQFEDANILVNNGSSTVTFDRSILSRQGSTGPGLWIAADGTLQGTIPAAAAPSSGETTYAFTVNASNKVGASLTAVKFNLVVTAPTGPVRTGKTDPTQNPTSQGGGLTTVNYDDGYYDNGPITLDANDVNQLSVVYTPPGGVAQAKTTLAASSLGENYQQGGHYIQLSGLELKGNVPDNAPAGTYFISALPKNGTGKLADKPVNLSLVVTGPPVYLNGHNPASQTRNLAASFNADFSGSFGSNDGSTIQLDPSSVTVSVNGATPVALADSPFKDAVTVDSSAMTLSGTIPNNSAIQAGNDTFYVKAKNDAGTSASAAPYVLTVSDVPMYSGGMPATSTFYAGQAFNPDANGLDVHQYFNPSNANLYLSDSDSSSIKVCGQNGTVLSQCLSLKGSGLGLALDAAGNVSPKIHGTLLMPASFNTNASQQFQMSITPRNSAGVSGSTMNYSFTLIGPPVRNTTAAPAAITLNSNESTSIGDPITLSNYFSNNDNGGANQMVFDPTDHRYNDGIQVSSGGVTKNFVDSALYNNGQGLQVVDGELKGNVPLSAFPASGSKTYLILVYAYNTQVGKSLKSLQISLTLRKQSYADFQPCPSLDNAFHSGGTPGITISNEQVTLPEDTFDLMYQLDGFKYGYTGSTWGEGVFGFLENPNVQLKRNWAELRPNASGTGYRIACTYYTDPDNHSVQIISTYNDIPMGTVFKEQGNAQTCYFSGSSGCTLAVPQSWLKRMHMR